MTDSEWAKVPDDELSALVEKAIGMYESGYYGRSGEEATACMESFIAAARRWLADRKVDRRIDEYQLKVYGEELDAAAEILQRVHPMGAVKAIGRREVAAALQDLFPEESR